MYDAQIYYLYTLKDCQGCKNAKAVLQSKNKKYKEVRIDNPAVEIATKMLFNGKVYAPYVFQPKEGLYIFNDKDMLKVKLCTSAEKS